MPAGVVLYGAKPTHDHLVRAKVESRPARWESPQYHVPRSELSRSLGLAACSPHAILVCCCAPSVHDTHTSVVGSTGLQDALGMAHETLGSLHMLLAERLHIRTRTSI